MRALRQDREVRAEGAARVRLGDGIATHRCRQL